MPLTPHDEDLTRFPVRSGYDDAIGLIEGMEDDQDPTIQRLPAGYPMGDVAVPAPASSSIFSMKTILVLLVLGVGGYLLYKKMQKGKK